MNDNDKWNEFLKNGSVLAYLSYAADKKSQEEQKKNENTNSGTYYQGNQYR